MNNGTTEQRTCLSVLYWSTFVDVVAVIVLVLKGKDK